jgi:pantoate kinase
LKDATAFSPCNITGIFRIYDTSIDPLRIGSTGAAVALELGVTTHVKITKTPKTRIHATFNGRPLPRQSVSHFAAEKYAKLDGRAIQIDIVHTSRLPIGCGFGTSGAGALSLSLALNEIMGLSLDRVEAAQIAHVSEIACRTGLGTVSSAFSGGFTLRTSPGAPGVGKVTRINLPKSFRVVTASFGPISTRNVLGRKPIKDRVNLCAKSLLDKFDLNDPRTSFMRVSRKFSDCLGLMSRRLARLSQRLDSTGFESSMAMLGESLFGINPDDEAAKTATCIRKEGLTPIVSPISSSGAHLV